jgi:hypothetical protein
MRCTHCGAENPDPKKFCAECGKAFVAREDVPVPGEPGVYYCSKHRKETTRITCGRCEKPICPKCTVHGPVGVRCHACARNKVAIRPRGVLHSAGQQMDTPLGRTVWYVAVWAIVVNIVSNIFGGRDS